MAARFGYTSDLTPKERRDMIRFNRKLSVVRRTNEAKRFLKDAAPIIALGTLAVVLIFFRKEVRETVGEAPRGQLTP